jgi:hypothetical protein
MVSQESRVFTWILSLRRSGCDRPTEVVPELVRVTEMVPSSYGYITSGSNVTLVTQTCAAASTDVDVVDDVDDVDDVDEDVDVLSAADTAEAITRTRMKLAIMVCIFIVPP